MTPRTVVSVGLNGEEALEVRLTKAPVSYPKAFVPQPLGCDPEGMPAWTTPRAVEAHGRELLTKLSSHPAIGPALTDLMRAPFAQKRPLYFHILADEAERLWWEALCDDQGQFLSLDARWPIARMADSGVDQEVSVYDFTPPLKVLVLLSAQDRDAIPEWQRFYEALASARQNGLAISAIALVGQPSLLQSLTEDIDAKKVTGVTVQPMPDRLADLDAVVNNFNPHIVHFFCHGAASSGISILELAVLADWTKSESTDRRPLRLAVESLMGIKGMQGAWLVTLNCCEGGKSVERLHSMAYRLVAAGIPTAVGMLEPVDVTDAYEFCGYFYSTAFTAVSEALQKAGNNGAAEVQWTDALYPPRTALCDHRDPADNRQWVRPVLYVRPDPFEIRKLQAAALPPEKIAEMRKRAETVAGALRALPADTPPETRQSILALLADLPAEMRPDASGNFSSGA